MLDKLWSLLLYASGLLEGLISCPPIPDAYEGLHNPKPYLGKWYFISAAGYSEKDIALYRVMDSTVFYLQEAAENGTLLLTGAIRIGDNCLTKVWTYHVRPNDYLLDMEGRPELSSKLLKTPWLNHSDCIVLQETVLGEGGLKRTMLYARNASVDADVVKRFQAKLCCNGMCENFILPQEREYCQMEGAAST
ncbi:hypothetical protein AGOR_G00044740 [Albula goreensis]|uniref:Apolipoprotein M n=1 Tax=Albula goreensis TaxID=1534307 RepID=A0A8T3E2F8_9TELE|nr:hypothetical protein AGOR_G00044740 [Albula goreensis]